MRAAPGITSAAGYQPPPDHREAEPARNEAGPARNKTGPDWSSPPGQACGRGHGERASLWHLSWSRG